MKLVNEGSAINYYMQIYEIMCEIKILKQIEFLSNEWGITIKCTYSHSITSLA